MNANFKAGLLVGILTGEFKVSKYMVPRQDQDLENEPLELELTAEKTGFKVNLKISEIEITNLDQE